MPRNDVEGWVQPFNRRFGLGCFLACFAAVIWFPSHGLVQLLQTVIGAVVVAFLLAVLLRRLLWPVWRRSATAAIARRATDRMAFLVADGLSGLAVTIGFLIVLLALSVVDIRVVPDYVGWSMVFLLTVANMGAWLALPTALVVGVGAYWQGAK